MGKSIAFCSVVESVNERGVKYLEQQERLLDSIQEIYRGYAPTFFHSKTLPKGAKPFLESLYGFKVHAIQEARDAGFTKVAWVDAAMVLLKPLANLPSVVAVRDDSQLPASDRALEYFGLNRNQLQGLNLVGGSFYYFDFNYPIAEMIFGYWKQAEIDGIFGSQKQESFEGLQGHRHDETCMALSMHAHAYDPIPPDKIGYNGITMSKQHFK